MTHLEGLFRRFLVVMAQAPDTGMPPLLRESLYDHRARTDTRGYTLCFDGPTRDQLLDLLADWLHTIRQQPTEKPA
jgi:hypothetical protein